MGNGEATRLKRTIDGGKTWSDFRTPIPVSGFVAGGLRDWSAISNDTATIFRSEDDGASWYEELVNPASDDALALQASQLSNWGWRRLWRFPCGGYALGALRSKAWDDVTTQAFLAHATLEPKADRSTCGCLGPQ
jgi:hypothetical protein